jgi:hypothetical protein
MVTMPALAGRATGAVPAAQATVAAGVVACLALALATVEHYPQMMSTDASRGGFLAVVFDMASACYLGMAWLLPRRLPATNRNSLYGLGAGLVLATAAAYYIARPSLTGLWTGPQPGNSAYLLACLTVPAASALAAARRGRAADGLETAAWATLLASLITSIMIIAATFRMAPSADGSPLIAADAHRHGMASASAWLADDNLGGAIISLIWMPVVFLALAGCGIVIGCAVRAVALGRAGGHR